MRGWLASANPDLPWKVLPPSPSEGQGVADSIELALESANALLEIYDHVRRWISNRGKHAKPVTAQAVVEIDGKPYELIVTLNPVERGSGRAS